MPLPRHLVETLASELHDCRVAVDVSVLLAGLLDGDSPSMRTIQACYGGTIVLPQHVEEMARKVLSFKAPGLLPNFNDALLRLGRDARIERFPQGTPSSAPPELVAKLDAEDQRVLEGALAGGADRRFTHDSRFFLRPVPGLVVQSPATFAFSPMESVDVRQNSGGFTFLGWFVPQWGSSIFGATHAIFYMFEVAGFMQCYYETQSRAYRLRWRTPSGATGGVRIQQEVAMGGYHFVAVSCTHEEVTLFVNGETRGRKDRFGAIPRSTTFHPFMSAQSLHQISGGCQFRLTGRAYSVSSLRKHYQARSVCLTDGELQFGKWARSLFIVNPRNAGRVGPPG